MASRVLIVDDEEAVSTMLRLAFESDGYAVVTAASAAEGLRLLAGGSF